jgi:tRNA-specific 2-thiouridylase
MAKVSVLIAMSGGVDSSVAAVKLLEAGYRVIGITMKLWDSQEGFSPGRGCCSLDDARDAQAVAGKLGFPHYVLNLKDEFQKYVIDDFISEYRTGRTPNPCIRCNSFLKWGALWEKKRSLGVDFIATGHYAQILPTEDGVGLFRAKSSDKDQSYALWGISRNKLAHTLLPLGALEKAEVRKIAQNLGLRVADKAESQEICFIPDNDYSAFLHNIGIEIGEGEIVDEAGNIIGHHPGYHHYTIGQRKGLGGGFIAPMFVYMIDPQTNRIYVGEREKILFNIVYASNINWLISHPPDSEFTAIVKVRYRDAGREAVISLLSEKSLKAYFPQGVEAPTPGQSLVVYDKERVIAGGIIDRCELHK